MVDVFNSLNVKVSCLGNHDLDFGIERMKELVSMTSPCEWLMSNLTIKETGRPIGDLARWTTKEVKTKSGTMKVGFFGVAEKEWLDLFGHTVPEAIEYKDYLETARELSLFLRED